MSTADEIIEIIASIRAMQAKINRRVHDDMMDSFTYGMYNLARPKPQSPLRLEDCTVVATLDPPGFALHRYRNLQDVPLKVYFGDSHTEAMNTFKLYLITKRLTT